jgi:hypothetical protein
MRPEFVTLTKQDFTAWADYYFGPNDYHISTPARGTELVICHRYPVHGLECHIYTTVEEREGVTRSVGEDAVRIILWDRFAGKICYQESKILRVEGDTTVQERLTDRVNHMNKVVDLMQQQNRFCKCVQNRVHTVKRTRQSDGAVFYGCSIFGQCSKSGFNKMENAFKNYPLKENPFKDQNYQMSAVSPEIERKIETLAIKSHTTLPKNPNFKNWDINTEQACVPTEQWPFIRYPFKEFNHVQTTVYHSNVWNKDCNLILGTATSSGKTICAEMIIAQILYGN